MSKRLLVATFADEQDVLQAVEASRQQGYNIVDVYAPYAVHGLETALGWRPSRLPWIVFAAALAAAALKVWFEYWTSVVDWPINVGGKPWNSLPAWVPVTFEVMVLAAGLTAVLVFLVVCKLYPGKRERLPVPRVTEDRFALILEESDSRFDVAKVSQLLASCHPVAIQEHAGEEM